MGVYTEYRVSSDTKPDIGTTLYIFNADEDIPFSRNTSYRASVGSDQSPIGARTSNASIHTLLRAGYLSSSPATRPI